MKFCVLSLMLLVAVVAADEAKYTTKYDNINVDELINNDRLLKKYEECLLDNTDVNCPQEGKYLRGVISDALETGCSKCTEKQKEIARKIIRFLIKTKPEVWEALKKKYDPNEMYQEKYRDMLEEVSS